MFLFERIFGFSLYMVVLLFVCMFLSKTNVSSKLILKVYLACLCVMAFFYEPYITADLYRIYNMMEFFGEMKLLYCWEYHISDSSTPVAYLLYWCIGKIGINELLPTLSAFVCYTFIFYIITKTQKIFSVSNENIAYVLFFIMTTSVYISVIGGIRMMMALSMIAFCFFRGTVEKKTGVFEIILYGLSIFMHSMALVIIAICIVATIFDTRKSLVRRIVVMSVFCIAAVVFALNFKSVVTSLFEKAKEFISGGGYYDVWEYIMGVLIMILLVIITLEYWRVRKEDIHFSKIQSYSVAAVICLAVAAIFCFEFSIFYRFGAQLAVILSIPMMLVTLEKTRDRPSRVVTILDIRSILLIFSVFIAAISCTRGSLSSLKFFEL